MPYTLFDSPHPPGQDEDLRQALLLSLGLCETSREAAFDGLTLAASVATGCPMALLGMFNHGRPGFKAQHGMADDAALQASLLTLCAGRPQGGEHDGDGLRHCGLRYLVSEPVRLEGVAMGALCVADSQPHTLLSDEARQALRGLADAAEALLAARRSELEPHAQALRRRQALLVRATHEMRTPLNAILGFAQLLQMEPGLAGTRNVIWLKHIEAASHQLLVLIENMLGLARQAVLTALPNGQKPPVQD
ncbi:MAG: hypothetical protein JF607_17275 [Burkholderiales bacterium]|jgi:signal transduction histidine kinase|nr:hypothetical protein [Burkholderiales bacterium]